MNTSVNILCESDPYDRHRLDRPTVVERKLFIYDTSICFRIEITNKHAGLSDIVPAARAVCDAITEPMQTFVSTSNGCRISCRKGCSACCSYLVPLSMAEVLRLQSEFLLLPADERISILRSCVDAASKLLKQNTTQLSNLEDSHLSEWYMGLEIQCPFLSNGLCRIYEQRPLACREHIVTSPSAWCGGGGLHKPHIVQLPVSILESLGMLVAKLEHSEIQAVMLPLALISDDAFSALSKQAWPTVQMVNLFFDIIEETATENTETGRLVATESMDCTGW
jgi:Fe-S-cluster containining protein